MNCANHPDTGANVFCRTCGKPLCASCSRDVQGVVYCEQCLAERLKDVHPPQPTVYQQIMKQGAGLDVPPSPGPGPNPALAGILAGFFPFGVGAVYTGQYAKGLAHLVIFTLLVWGESVTHNGGINTILGLGIAFFYVYQIIDAVKSAHAIRQGLPAPDPFGLAGMFGAVDPVRPSSAAAPVAVGSTTAGFAPVTAQQATPNKIPTAAIILIALGVLFLIRPSGIFYLDHFDSDFFWPVILIGIGGWLAAVRLGYAGSRRLRSHRGWMAPVILITIGLLDLLEKIDDGLGWSKTWPILLLAIGVTKLLERNAAPTAPYAPYPPVGVSGTVPPVAPIVNEGNSGEVNRG